MGQLLVTGLLVGACAAYAAWTLMPSAWRRALRPGSGAAAASGCGGCSGCGTPAPPGGAQVVRIVRRP